MEGSHGIGCTRHTWRPRDQVQNVDMLWVCLKIVYPYTQWLMIIIPIKWLFHWEYTLFSDKSLSCQENQSTPCVSFPGHRFSILEWRVDEAFDIFTIFHIWFWRRPMVWYFKIVERDMTTNNPLKSLIFWISVIASFPVSRSNCQAAAASHEGGNVPPFDFWGNMTIQWDLLMATMIGN